MNGPRRLRRWWPLAASATGGVALAAAVWLNPAAAAPQVAALPSGPKARADRGSASERVERPTALESPAPQAVASAMRAADETPAVSHPARPDVRAARASARQAMRELAQALDGRVFERTRWVQAARAAAHSLDGGGAADLEQALAEGAAPIGELVAGAEMLRVLRPEPVQGVGGEATLPARALDALRGTLGGLPDDPIAMAAARALVGTGTEADAEQFVSRLLLDSDVRSLEVARWALAANRRASVADFLAEGTLGLPAGDRFVLSLRALREMRGEAGEVLSAESLERLMRVAALHLLDPATSRSASSALVAVAEDLDPGATRDILVACLASPDAELARQSVQRLAHAGDEEAIRSVSDRLFTSTDPSESTAIAEGLVIAWNADAMTDDVRRAVLTTFESALLLADDAVARRRAAHGLGSTGDSASSEVLLRAMTQDADPRVRGAAGTALGRLPDAASHVEALRRAASQDASGAVRRTLANEVRRMEQ